VFPAQHVDGVLSNTECMEGYSDPAPDDNWFACEATPAVGATSFGVTGV